MAESSVQGAGGCCREAFCTRRYPPVLRRGGLTDRIYLVLEYSATRPGVIEATVKHDVTEQVEAFMRSEGWRPS